MSKSRQYLHNLCICLPFLETQIITLCFFFLSFMFFTRENPLWIWIFQRLFLGTFPFLDTLWFYCDIFMNSTDFFSFYFRQVNFIDFSPGMAWFKWIEKKLMKTIFAIRWKFMTVKNIGCGKTIAKVFSPQCTNRTFNIHKNPAIYKVLMP